MTQAILLAQFEVCTFHVITITNLTSLANDITHTKSV